MTTNTTLPLLLPPLLLLLPGLTERRLQYTTTTTTTSTTAAAGHISLPWPASLFSRYLQEKKIPRDSKKGSPNKPETGERKKRQREVPVE